MITVTLSLKRTFNGNILPVTLVEDNIAPRNFCNQLLVVLCLEWCVSTKTRIGLEKTKRTHPSDPVLHVIIGLIDTRMKKKMRGINDLQGVCDDSTTWKLNRSGRKAVCLLASKVQMVHLFDPAATMSIMPCCCLLTQYSTYQRAFHVLCGARPQGQHN